MRPLLGAIKHFNVKALLLRDAAELVDIARQCRHDEDARLVRIAGVEDDTVTEHPAVLIEEAGVACLTNLDRSHVIGKAVVDSLECVGTTEDPLLQRRLVPNTNGLANSVMLVEGIAEVGDPRPALPLREVAAIATQDAVECRLAKALSRWQWCRRLDDGDARGVNGR